jgi:hypothetical protein
MVCLQNIIQQGCLPASQESLRTSKIHQESQDHERCFVKPISHKSELKLESITVRIVTGTSLRSAIVRNAIVQAFPEDGPPFACGFAVIGRKSKLEDANICEHRTAVFSSDDLIAPPPIRVQRRPASFCGGLKFSNQHQNYEIHFCSNGSQPQPARTLIFFG